MMKRDAARDEEIVLRVLRMADSGEFTPASHIGGRLGVSSSMVSNIVRRLRERGVRIERNPGSGGGYRLEATRAVRT